MKRLAIGLLVLVLELVAAAHAQAPRDPFARPAGRALRGAAPAPAETQAEPDVRPQLRAIMYAPGRSLANINGQILAVGEWYGDYQLIKVQERSVTLARRGVKSVLGLDEASGK
jgi:hypothetical protein